MTILHQGFKLFQPWANEVVEGKLNFLVRSIPTNIEGRVAVIASRGLDAEWLVKVSDKEIMRIESQVGAIGSIDIKDCIEVKQNKIKDEIIKLGGEKYWDYYPKHLIPTYSRKRVMYIWKLENARKWDKAKEVTSKGILWAKIGLNDE